MTYLSATEIKLRARLAYLEDVRISEIYALVSRRRIETWMTTQHLQRHVSAVVSRLNRKLQDEGERIVPGIERRTYRLVLVQKGVVVDPVLKV